MKVDYDRLRRKYGYYGWSHSTYSDLISKIIARGSAGVAKTILKIDQKKLLNFSKRARIKEWKNLVVPDVSELITDDSVFVKKSAESGRIITNTLRNKLNGALYRILSNNRMTVPSGVNAGKINHKNVELFESELVNIFNSYTKRNPLFNMPTNIHQIAVTEVRGITNLYRHKFVERLINNNKNLMVTKTWVHNTNLVKKPRLHHLAMDGVTINYNDVFVFKNGVRMRYPHDETAPASEIINCHCELKYSMKKIPHKDAVSKLS